MEKMKRRGKEKDKKEKGKREKKIKKGNTGGVGRQVIGGLLSSQSSAQKNENGEPGEGRKKERKKINIDC